MSDALAIPDLAPGGTHWYTRWIDWVVSARSHRVMCILVGLWVINGFDIVLTVHAHQQGMLDESNPIARQLLLHSPLAVLIYKLGLISFASFVLLKYRTRLVAEVAAAGTLFIYTIVAIQWRLCYELYFLTYIGDLKGYDIDSVNLTSIALHWLL